jgi:glycogen(starch) synthase
LKRTARSARRVLYWTEVFFPYTGGTEVLSGKLLEGLRRRGHEFTIVTDKGALDLAEQDVHDGIPVHRLPFQDAIARRDVGGIAEIGSRISALRSTFAPELVHVNAVGPSLFFHLRATRSAAVPWLFTPHAPLTNQATGLDTLLGEALRSADWVVCLSAAQRESILRLAPEVLARSSVIHCGLEPPAGPPTPLPFDHPRALCLGRHVSDKGFDVALAAFARVADRFSRLRLTIAGDGPARPALERRAVDLGIADRVDFLGRVPDVSATVNAATFVLMPSRWEETFGLVALEAALLGRPVVATRVGALPEVVLDGETGLIVEREDAAGLAAAIASLLEDPERTRRMGRTARARALGTFSLEQSLDAYEALYERFAQRGATIGSQPARR